MYSDAESKYITTSHHHHMFIINNDILFTADLVFESKLRVICFFFDVFFCGCVANAIQ